jgi:bifunctional non-homologous end joining protein LigD
MLAAVAGDGPDRRATWALEMKWDGIRALAVLDGGALRLVSRNDLDLTPTYPELGILPEAVDARSAVLDGEIVALDERGRPSFSRLQQRSGLTRQGDVERARRRVPIRYLLFDVLEVDGRSLLQEPYRERRAVLERIITARDGIAVPPSVGEASGDGLEDAVAGALAVSEQLGLEGVVAKRVDSPYTSGRRSADWLKLKHERAQEVVVGGWRPGNGRRAGGVGSLLLGIPTEDGLEYVGRVGTGFSDRELMEAGRRLQALASVESPFREVPRPDARDAHWVAPELVGEVRFAEWTHGGHLRQPSWRGWRPDKRPAEVVREP